MDFKIACVLFSAVVIQTITGQCLRGPQPIAFPNEIATANLAPELPISYPTPASPIAYEPAMGPGVPGLNFGMTLAELSASNGGGLRVNSVSPMASTGVTIETDKMVIEGPLAVTGQLPFLGAVALEGSLPATGTGAVAYECGNGQIGIMNEGIEPAYPNGPMPAYPNGPMVPAYPNGPYPNMPYPGYPNAGITPFPNGLAPGYSPIPRGIA